MMAGSTICLTVLGRDRPGIIAGVSGVLCELDCNIRDSTMTILAGECAMVLIVELPTGLSPAGLDRSLRDIAHRFDLTVFVKGLEAEELRHDPPAGARSLGVTIYGSDQKGLVHHVALVMARKGISISELKTRVIRGLEGAGIISLKILAPPGTDLQSVREQLEDLATRFGVEVSIG